MFDGWQENDGYFWFGANGCEFIAWKGSHQIFVYPSWEYPKPPSEIINYHSRIETNEVFFDALYNGQKMSAEYKMIGGDDNGRESNSSKQDHPVGQQEAQTSEQRGFQASAESSSGWSE